jgi:sulfonate transport system substrate-binding protein
MMAASELENGDVLFYRNAEANSWGVLDVREDFAKQHPDVVAKVLAGYEEARRWALANPRAFKDIIVAFTRLPAPVIDRQIDTRTDLTHNAIGDEQRRSIAAAGRALQSAGILPQGVDVNAAADSLLDAHFFAAAAADAAR